MQIGSAAEASGVTPKMIRHYEVIGLITQGARRMNNYRDYDQKEVHELRFIRSARDLGFSLEEIRGLLDLWRDKRRQSSDVSKLVSDHLAGIERKLVELHLIASTLKALLGSCHGDQRPECPILDGLSGHRFEGD